MKVYFLKRPQFEAITGGFKIIQPGSISVVVGKKRTIINLPIGFKFNGFSFPGMQTRRLVPSAYHDFLYRNSGCDRKFADRAFLELLKHERCRFPMLSYYAVRAFGWLFYKK